MRSNIRILVVFALLMTSIGIMADDGKSFSRQMNGIKRSGDYVYAESSAPNEADAKAACDALLKIEITKYIGKLDPQSQGGGRIIKDISDYNREYLVQPRGDMIRVFGYVAKGNIATPGKGRAEKGSPSSDNRQKQPSIVDDATLSEADDEKVLQTSSTSADATESIEETESTSVEMLPTDVVVQAEPALTEIAVPTEASATDIPVADSATQVSVDGLNTDGVQLARWQIDMLESIVREPDMAQAKKLLNRYKYQNRIKRLGEKSMPNPRPADSFYLIYRGPGRPVALLAPSSTGSHYDLLSGTTVNFDNYNSSQYFWFQISK